MKFTANYIVFLTIAIGTVALAKSEDSLYGKTADANLLHFISRSSNMLQENPQRSVTCFEYYIPLLNKLAVDYENAYKLCISSAEEAISAAEDNTEEQRDQLASNSEAACAAVSACKSNSEASAEDIFQCYVKSSSDSAKSLYGVSTQATVQLAALQELIRRIQNDESVCITENRLKYEKDSGEAYEEFNNCILGNSEVPTPTPPTDPPATDEPSSPEETPATDEPSSPEETPATDEPSSPEETPATDEPSSPEETPATDEPSSPEETPATDEPSSPEETPATEDPSSPEDEEKMPEEDIYRFIKRFKHFRG